MSIVLKEFQSEAVEALVSAVAESSRKVILKSCTGSGKTIILTHFIQEVVRTKGNVSFVWLTPGKGDLEEQSKGKMDRYIHSSKTCTLEDVLSSGFEASGTCFANWERLTKRGNIALREGERKNFLERIEEAHRDGIEFIVVIDESHQNDTGKANDIIEALDPIKVIRSSATPRRDDEAILVDVPEWKVVEQGLIKKNILLNPDFGSNIEVGDEVDFLLSRAFARRQKIVQACRENGANFNPLILVQLENDNEELLHRVERWFDAVGISYENGLLAVWLSGNHENREGVEEPDAKQVALVFKQAIATGWDCPRACILVKLRENMSETFSIQTIGRIRRMPEGHHYGDEALDNCFIYTLDAQFITDAKDAMSGRVLDSKTLKLKAEHANIELVSEQKSSFSTSLDARAALDAIRSHFARKYELGEDLEANRTRLGAQGYLFADTMADVTRTGEVGMSEAPDLGRLSQVQIGITASRETVHANFNNTLSKLAVKTGFGAGSGYSTLGTVLRRLLDERQNKGRGSKNILSLGMMELHLFVINNENRIKEDIREALAEVAVTEPLPLGLKTEKTFRLPEEFVVTYDKESTDQTVMVRNVYEGYPNSVSPRSMSERSFELYCEEQSARVRWFYKNGDKGSEYLSIVYMDNAARQKSFYPDYVVGVGDDGEMWIIETKGGWSACGENRDIDLYSAKKHHILRSYCERHGLKGGFVRLDGRSLRLMICDFGSEYTEDLDTESWKPLRDVLR